MKTSTDTTAVTSPSYATTSGPETFPYTGSAQSWTVPSGVTSVQVDARGAQGGGAYGGLGSRVVAVLAVTPGELLKVYVGGQPGGNNATGFNGGASGGEFADGGGDASDVRLGGTALADSGGGRRRRWGHLGGGKC